MFGRGGVIVDRLLYRMRVVGLWWFWYCLVLVYVGLCLMDFMLIVLVRRHVFVVSSYCWFVWLLFV